MKLTRAIRELVTQIVARDVAAGVELARSLGYSMPKDFAVGVSFVEDGDLTRVRMRLDDASHDAIVRLPHLDGRETLARTDALWSVPGSTSTAKHSSSRSDGSTSILRRVLPQRLP
jgi:hypothetical protein